MELNSLGEKILSEIAQQGAIPFARFMDLALYCPEMGYYEREADIIGRRGDFYTSVSVGGLFGELLGWQFAEWLAAGGELGGAGGKTPVRLIEAGAHDGRLARDILAGLQKNNPDVFARLEYCVVEPSARRQAWQRETLREFLARVRWAEDFTALGSATDGPLRGVIFANELLDAFPVHRLGWNAAERRWFEWGVTVQGKEFAWTRLPSPPDLAVLSWVARLPDELLAVLPDGYTLEVCPPAEAWWHMAAKSLAAGWLVTFDYGRTTEELLTPERPGGTLRAYRQHRLVENMLAQPGEQDLTAHVNFSAIQAAGEAAGLRTECLQTQGRFLTQVAAQRWQGHADDEWTGAQRREFQTLIHPVHLGQSFRVLVQSRGR